MLPKSPWPSTLLVTFCIASALAAKRDNVFGKAKSTIASPSYVTDASKFVNLPKGSSLKQVKSRVDITDRKVKYKQYHMGVPVFGSILTAQQFDDGSLSGEFQGQLVSGIEVNSVTPTITHEQALFALQSKFGHHTLSAAQVRIRSNSTLFICLDKENVAQLCYHVDYFIESKGGRQISGLPMRPHGLVNAKNSAIIDTWNGLTHTNFLQSKAKWLGQQLRSIKYSANYRARLAVDIQQGSAATTARATSATAAATTKSSITVRTSSTTRAAPTTRTSPTTRASPTTRTAPTTLTAASPRPLVTNTQVVNQTRPRIGIIEIPGIGGNMGAMGRRVYNNLRVLTTGDGVTCRYDTNNVQVQHMRGSTFLPFVPMSFKCSDALSETFDFVNGGYSSLNDAALHAEIVVAMFKAYAGSNGPTGVLPLRARVHYGTRYENAFWDGETMTIGDGAFTFYPLIALDVVAHEYGHGFTSVNSRLQYAYQSGGINEAFSDMAGEAAEYFATGKNDFEIGKTIMKDGSSLRYMCNPSRDGNSIESALRYNNFINVHHSSGVYNKAFCVLAKTPGWDTASAFKVFARANDLYWGAQTGFDYGACGVQQAAQDLLMNVTQVANAFAAVNVACR